MNVQICNYRLSDYEGLQSLTVLAGFEPLSAVVVDQEIFITGIVRTLPDQNLPHVQLDMLLIFGYSSDVANLFGVNPDDYVYLSTVVNPSGLPGEDSIINIFQKTSQEPS